MLFAKPAILISLWGFCLPVTNTFKISIYESLVAYLVWGFSASIIVNSERTEFLNCIETLDGAYGK